MWNRHSNKRSSSSPAWLGVECEKQDNQKGCERGYCEWRKNGWPEFWRGGHCDFLIPRGASGNLNAEQERQVLEMWKEADLALRFQQSRELEGFLANLTRAGWVPWWLNLKDLLLEPHPSLTPEEDARLMIDGPDIQFLWVIWNLAASLAYLAAPAGDGEVISAQQRKWWKYLVQTPVESQWLRNLLLDLLFRIPILNDDDDQSVVVTSFWDLVAILIREIDRRFSVK